MRHWLALFLLPPSFALADEIAQPVDGANPKPVNRHACLLTDVGQAMSIRGERGTRTVRLDFQIAKTGAVEDVGVAISSDDPIFDAAAMKCVQNWRYEPATANGQPVEMAWTTMISVSNDTGAGPAAAQFDAAASSPLVQSCKFRSSAEIEKRWLSLNKFSKPSGANDGFECVHLGNEALFCHSKPGEARGATIVTTTFYSTGARLKLGVEVQTADDCKVAMPVTFKNKLPM